MLKNLLLLGLVAGCVMTPWVRPPGDPATGVSLSWLGHSAFSLEDSVGRRWLVDPYDETVSDRQKWPKPTALLMTHDHFDHDFRPAGKYEVVNTTGVHSVDGIEVTALSSDHDGEGGKRHWRNRILVWSMGGVTWAHLGDVGTDALPPEVLSVLQGVDVLFVSVGGQTTVDARGALSLIQQIRPRLAVPMHYGHPRLRFFPFDSVEVFTSLLDNTKDDTGAKVYPLQRLKDSQWKVTRGSLPDRTQVIIPAWPEP